VFGVFGVGTGGTGGCDDRIGSVAGSISCGLSASGEGLGTGDMFFSFVLRTKVEPGAESRCK
jgi:hypothetical protein